MTNRKMVNPKILLAVGAAVLLLSSAIAIFFAAGYTPDPVRARFRTRRSSPRPPPRRCSRHRRRHPISRCRAWVRPATTANRPSRSRPRPTNPRRRRPAAPPARTDRAAGCVSRRPSAGRRYPARRCPDCGRNGGASRRRSAPDPGSGGETVRDRVQFEPKGWSGRPLNRRKPSLTLRDAPLASTSLIRAKTSKCGLSQR